MINCAHAKAEKNIPVIQKTCYSNPGCFEGLPVAVKAEAVKSGLGLACSARKSGPARNTDQKISSFLPR